MSLLLDSVLLRAPGAWSQGHKQSMKTFGKRKGVIRTTRTRVKEGIHESGSVNSAPGRSRTRSTAQVDPGKQSSKLTSKILQIDDKKQGKLIEQLAESKKQMSRRLSEANKYVSFLERRMEDGNQAMHEAFRVMQKVIDELDALSCLTVTVAASLKFGVDEDDTINKLSALQKRLDVTHVALEQEKEIIAKNCPRRVPITWVGVAQEVRLMGDFDGWTRGKELSAEEISEQVMSEFCVTLELLPGRYEFKLLVNDEWRLTDAFPTVTHDSGVTNNVLVVD